MLANGCQVLTDPETNKDWCSHEMVPEYCSCMCNRVSEPVVPVLPVERNSHNCFDSRVNLMCWF